MKSEGGLSSLFELQGKTALVTGSSRGLGKAIAWGFLQQGAKVYVSSRRAEACAEAVEDLRAFGDCIAAPADVASEAGMAALSAQIREAEPGLDIVVHNAGAAWVADFDTFPVKDWDKVMDLNLKTPFFLTQALAPLLRKAARHAPAKVINNASIDGLSVNAQETYSYAASKAGLVHLTRRLALRFAPENIRVNCIAPGIFPSDMNVRARDAGNELASRIPAGRLGRAEDIAAATIYLASSACDYDTGETLVLDGGLCWVRKH